MTFVRTYIEAARRPRYKARDIVETATGSDGSEMRQSVVSLPPGTLSVVVGNVVDALQRAYQAGREDAGAELRAYRMLAEYVFISGGHQIIELATAEPDASDGLTADMAAAARDVIEAFNRLGGLDTIAAVRAGHGLQR